VAKLILQSARSQDRRGRRPPQRSGWASTACLDRRGRRPPQRSGWASTGLPGLRGSAATEALMLLADGRSLRTPGFPSAN